MRNNELPDNAKFRKMVIRDATAIVLLSATIAIGIGLVLYWSVKNNW